MQLLVTINIFLVLLSQWQLVRPWAAKTTRSSSSFLTPPRGADWTEMCSCVTPPLEVLAASRPHHSCLHQFLLQRPLTPELWASAAGLICEAEHLGSPPGSVPQPQLWNLGCRVQKGLWQKSIKCWENNWKARNPCQDSTHSQPLKIKGWEEPHQLTWAINSFPWHYCTQGNTWGCGQASVEKNSPIFHCNFNLLANRLQWELVCINTDECLKCEKLLNSKWTQISVLQQTRYPCYSSCSSF